jgi:hypothetical protein
MSHELDVPVTYAPTRRTFLRLGGAAAAAVASQALGGPAGLPDNPATAQAMPTRNLEVLRSEVGYP